LAGCQGPRRSNEAKVKINEKIDPKKFETK